jgi:O-antigen/teichoic acid export membrane protein
VGLYTNAYQLIALPISQIQYPVNTVALPALSALQTEPSEFRSYYEKMVHFLTFVCMPVVMFLILFADIIIDLLLGPQWEKAVPIFQIISISAFVEPVVHATGPAMVACGKTNEYFKLGIINALSLLICISLGSFWGAIGVAIGYTIAVYLAFIACLGYGLRQTPIEIFFILKKLAITFFCSILTLLIIICVRYFVGWNFVPYWLFLFVIGGASIYLLIWTLIPEGKQTLRGYLKYAKDMKPLRK